ncbi:uncharacterized protein LOC131437504 isoform X2 [Malaya genurostris]|uniref:uncharacterized protein LOC131437504 isoform X2 n=1 Tax=Malaya genurostris TaxID=325434 RepID=UPI0026F3BCA0|nr:uncharacterized protein LOC131437504 isoform X2 [Malaya genurostris]
MAFVLRCLVLLVAVALVSPHSIKSLLSECKKTMEISDELEKSILELTFPQDEQTMGCLMHCFGIKLHIFEPEGGMNLTSLEAALAGMDGSKKELSEKQQKCLEKISDDSKDSCGMAYNTYKCFEQEFIELVKIDLKEQE